MRIRASIRTMFGQSSTASPETIPVALTPYELFAAIRHVERDADEARAVGNDATADRLEYRSGSDAGIYGW